MPDMTDTACVSAIVLSALSEILREPEADIRAQPVLAAHDWDSVTSLEVLAQLEGQLEVTLDLRAYHAARTFDDLIDLVTAAGRR
jgi:acyl carrier protein